MQSDKSTNTTRVSIPQHSRVLGKGQSPGKQGFKPPRTRWNDVCKWCRGTGLVQGLRGWEPCQGCEDAEIEEIIQEWKDVEGGMQP